MMREGISDMLQLSKPIGHVNLGGTRTVPRILSSGRLSLA